jgi:hypothetical protein
MTDDDLHRLLKDAVSDVRPRSGLDQIRARTAEETPMHRPWIPVSLAAAAVVAVVIGGASLLLDHDSPANTPAAQPSHQGRHTSAPASPAASAATSPATSGPSADASPSAGSSGTGTPAGQAVPVYWLGPTAHGQKLYREFFRGSTADAPREAATAAVSGTPSDPDYRTAWPAGTGVGSVRYEGGTITVDLTASDAAAVHDRPAGMSAEQAQLSVQQLIYTVQGAVQQGRPPVQLLLDGQHVDTILGVPASEPLANDNADSVLAPVSVTDPAEGATVGTTFTVTGQAATFEANVVWELTSDGTVVRHGFTTARECCTLAPYSFTVQAPAGSYTLVVHDTDESGAGRPVDRDTKDITVQ